MPYDAFISHSNAAKLTAYAICNKLESNGIRCWILPRDLSGGTGWDRSISSAIQSCRVIVVVLTDYANRSERVERQIELAFASGAVVIPFRADSSSRQSEPPEPDNSLHWLDAITPEAMERIKNLSEQVQGILSADKTLGLQIASTSAGNVLVQAKNEQEPAFPDHGCSTHVINDLEPERMEAGSAPERGPLVARRPILREEFADEEPVSVLRKNTFNWLKIRALVLTLAPFVIIFGVGFCQMQKPRGMLNPELSLTAPAVANPSIRSGSGMARVPLQVPGSAIEPNVVALASNGAPKTSPTLIVQRREEIGPSDPGWGPTDANWSHPDNQIRLTPLMGNGAILVNTVHRFTDADISAEVVMSKGEDTDQLGGLIFWAKDYNDCYALVVSADGKFAIGRKLFGRWINPTAKTGSSAVRTGLGQVNRLRVQTQGDLFTASINDIKVATLSGEPPKSPWLIGVYGESAELSENAWDFTKLRVAVAPEPGQSPAWLANP
jgi:TIR domain